MNLIPINRPIQIAMPGQVRFQPPARTDDALYQGLSSFGKSIGGLLDDYFQRQALQATVPTVEEIAQYDSPPEEKRQPATQPATDQFVYGDESFAAPQQGLTGPVQPPTPNQYYAQGYRYKMGDELLYEQPSPDALAAQQALARAEYYGSRGDTANEMQYRRLAEFNQAKLREGAWGQVDTAATLDDALRAHNDIPDGLTSSLRQRDDGMYELLRGPTGGKARVVTVGDAKAVQDFLRRDVSPENFQAAEDKAYTRGRQAEQDQRAIATEARLRESAEMSKIAAQRQLVAQQLAVVTDELTLKPGGPILSEDQFKALRMKQDALREQLLKMDAVGPSGGLGPTGGGPAPAWMVGSESGGNWGAQNDVMGAGGRGHFGRLQFSQARLQEAQQALGTKFTTAQFMADPELQQQVEAWHLADIGQFVQDRGWDTSGKLVVRGVPMTPGAMLGVAHLGGKGGLEKYIESNGAYNPSDANGTRLSDYATKGHQSDIQQSPGPSRIDSALTQYGVPRPNAAPQHGLGGPVATGPATATPDPYAKEYEAYKAPKPLSLDELSKLQTLVDKQMELENTNGLEPADIAKLRKKIATEILTSTGRLPPGAAVDPTIAESQKAVAEKNGAPTPGKQGNFSAVVADETKGLQSEAYNKALAAEQVKHRAALANIQRSLPWFTDNKNSPMAQASAKEALALINGLWPTPLLTETDRVSVKQLVRELLRIFPQMQTQP